MADTFGGIELPVAATEPAGDPGLRKVGEFIQAVVNARCEAAWAAARPAPNTLPIRIVHTHNPEEDGFSSKDLPALFIWRDEGELYQRAEDWRTEDSKWRVLWVIPDEPQAKRLTRRTFWNPIEKSIDAALIAGIDPTWVDDDDPDVTAASIASDTDSIKLAVATSTAAQSYSGTALDGVRAGQTFSPRLQPTVTTSLVVAFDDPGVPDLGDEDLGVLEVYNTTDPIVWTCIDWSGRTVTRSRRLTLPFGGETIGPLEDVARVIAVDVPGQLSTLGSVAFGTGGYVGRGSDLCTRAGLDKIEVSKWARTKVQIEILNDENRVVQKDVYPALHVALLVREKYVFDLTDTTRFKSTSAPGGLDLDMYESDLLVNRAEL